MTGKYKVKVTKVFLKNWKVNLAVKVLFNALDDVKIFSNNIGHNEALGESWGFFKVNYFFDSILLEYGMDSNPAILRKVRDLLTKDGDDYEGVMLFSGKKILKFRLEKVDE